MKKIVLSVFAIVFATISLFGCDALAGDFSNLEKIYDDITLAESITIDLYMGNDDYSTTAKLKITSQGSYMKNTNSSGAVSEYMYVKIDDVCYAYNYIAHTKEWTREVIEQSEFDYYTFYLMPKFFLDDFDFFKPINTDDYEYDSKTKTHTMINDEAKESLDINSLTISYIDGRIIFEAKKDESVLTYQFYDLNKTTIEIPENTIENLQ